MNNKKSIISWAFYDWANSAFTTTVISGFFPLFLKFFWAPDLNPQESTYYLGLGNSIAALLLFAFSPLLGAISDKGENKKIFLFFFASLGIIACACLAKVPMGQWQWAMFFYILAFIGFVGGDTFYNALLLKITSPEQTNYVSSLGYALGYIGGGLLFAICVLLYLQPTWFGLSSGTAGIQISFVIVSIWWAIFAIPIFLFVKEKKESQSISGWAKIKAGVSQIFHTLRKIKNHKPIFYFLIAYWFYIDGATTITKMAVDYGIALGFPASSLIIALLLVQLIAFPATFINYKIGKIIGVKKAILLFILGYMVVTFLGVLMTKVIHFYLLAVALGCFQGGLFALSRSYYGSLIPKKQAGEFYGFYSMWTRFAALLGPLLVGIVAKYSGSSRISILSIVILFFIGAFLFVKFVDNPSN